MASCCKCKIELEVGKIGYCRIHRDAANRAWYHKHKKERQAYYKKYYKNRPVMKLNNEIVLCKICGKSFEKKHYRQTLCGDYKCLEKNKKIYNKKYRKSNPEYFKKYLLEYRTHAH